jgi:hypothetical protein
VLPSALLAALLAAVLAASLAALLAALFAVAGGHLCAVSLSNKYYVSRFDFRFSLLDCTC